MTLADALKAQAERYAPFILRANKRYEYLITPSPIVTERVDGVLTGRVEVYAARAAFFNPAIECWVVTRLRSVTLWEEDWRMELPGLYAHKTLSISIFFVDPQASRELAIIGGPLVTA